MVKRSESSVQTSPRKTSNKEVVQREESHAHENKINTFSILADPHPRNGEDYAIQLFYKTYKNGYQKSNMRVTEKRLDEDMETAHITVNDVQYTVNIRSGKIQKV